MPYYMRGAGFTAGAYGAQGGFFSSIGKFLGGAVQHLAPVAAVLPGPTGVIGRAITTVTSHPVISAAAGAAAAAGTTALLSGPHKTLPPGQGMVMPGGAGLHLHLHGRKARAVGMPGARRRRMNVCNPRALKRAIRRARGFEHLALKVIGFSHPHKKKGRPYFKRTRKAAHA